VEDVRVAGGGQLRGAERGDLREAADVGQQQRAAEPEGRVEDAA
jgi:hypothetical protein